MASAARSAARGRVAALSLLCALLFLPGVASTNEPQGSAPPDCPPSHTSSAFVDPKAEWTLGDGGQDCNVVCNVTTGGVCVESVWEAVADAAGFAVHAARLLGVDCYGELQFGTTAAAPFVAVADGTCHAVGANPLNITSHCSYRSPNARRLCPCATEAWGASPPFCTDAANWTGK